tara:strand:+ start:173 stop:508 length:336 start_codon:yes stop_codon:yes gene_type:complete
MSFRARVDIDVIYHELSDSSISIGSLSDHYLTNPTRCETVTDNVTSATEPITTLNMTTVSALALKNTGESTLRLEGCIDVTAGRLVILPVTELPTISAPSGTGSYKAVVFS